MLKLETNGGVSSNPPAKTVFTVTTATHISKIFTYHWNGGSGAPASGTIGLKNVTTGTMVGSWNVVPTYHGFDASLGATWPSTGDGPPYYYWYAQPNVDIPAGTYEVVNSSPSTWSYNTETQNMGIAWVYGYDAGATAPAAPRNLRYAFNGTMLTVSWDAASGATGYKLGLGIGSKSNWADYAIGNITQLGPFDASGIPGTYYLAVKALNGTQESMYSNEIAISILAAPGNLRYAFNGSMLTINWDAVNGATGYKLGLGVGSKSNWADYAIGNITQLGPFNASGIPGTYYLAVRANSGSQDSGYSNEISITITDGDGPEDVLRRILENQARGDLEAMYPDMAMGVYGAAADNKTREILAAVKTAVQFSDLTVKYRATLYDKDRNIAYVRLETSVKAYNASATETIEEGYLAILIKQAGAWKVLTVEPDDLLNLEIAQRNGTASAPADRTAAADNPLSAAEVNRRLDEIFRNPDLSINPDHAMKTLVKHPLNYIPFVGAASNAYDAVEAGNEALTNLWKGIKGDSDSLTVGIVKIGETGVGIVSIITPPIPLTQIPADTVKEMFAQLAIYKQKLIALRNLRRELASAQNDPDVVLTNLRLIRLATVNYAGQGFELTEEGAEAPLTVRKVKVLSNGIGNSLALKLVADLYIPSASNSQTITDYLSDLGVDISQTQGDILTELRQPAAQICRHCDKIITNFRNDTKVWWTTTCNKGYDSFNIRLTNKAVQTETAFPLEVTTFMNDPEPANMISAQDTDVCPVAQLKASCYLRGSVTGTYNIVTNSQNVVSKTGNITFGGGAPYGSTDILSTTFENYAVTTVTANSSLSTTLTVLLDSSLLVNSLSGSSSDAFGTRSFSISNIPLFSTHGPFAADGHTEKWFLAEGADACAYITSLTATSAMSKPGDLTLTGFSCDAGSKLDLRCYFYP